MVKIEDLTDAELDVLVAEKVMGWRHIYDKPGKKWLWDTWQTVQLPDGGSYSSGCHTICPRFSHDIACAFQVDKPEWEWLFGERGGDLHIVLCVQAEEDGIYEVVLPLDPDNKIPAYCRGRCIAALKAYGVEEV